MSLLLLYLATHTGALGTSLGVNTLATAMVADQLLISEMNFRAGVEAERQARKFGQLQENNYVD